jgi:hypothetical protein
VLLHPALVVVPAEQFHTGHAEGHGGEEGKRRVLVEEVVFGRVVDVGLTGRHGVEHFERADERTRGHLVDGQRAIGHLGDDAGRHRGGVVEDGEAVRNRRDHGQRAVALGVGRCCKSGGSSCRAAESRRAQE